MVAQTRSAVHSDSGEPTTAASAHKPNGVDQPYFGRNADEPKLRRRRRNTSSTADNSADGRDTSDHSTAEFYEPSTTLAPSSSTSTSTLTGDVSQQDAPAQKHAHFHVRHGYLTHARPTHSQLTHSPLDKEAPSQNYRGFVNLCMLLLFVNNIRLFLENAARYGLRVEVPGSRVPTSDWRWMFGLLAVVPVHHAITFGVEKFAATLYYRGPAQEGKQSEIPITSKKPWWPTAIHVAHFVLHMSSVCYVVRTCIWHPFIGFVTLAVHMVSFLKLTSFAATNTALRHAALYDRPLQDQSFYESSEQLHTLISEPHWPNNLTLGNFSYFSVAPTLCYQTSYPRSPRFRPFFLVKRLAECCLLFAAMYFVIEQNSSITVHDAVKDLMDPESARMGNTEWIARVVERILKLSVGSVLVWLMMFYGFFHSYLNALAEVLRFGDREFYAAWWNSSSLSEYWKTWNKPVYNHFKRHIYLPCVKAGMSPAGAVVTTFLVSAVLHELIVGLPIHALYGWAFFGMIGQIPLILLTASLGKDSRVSTLGNLIFWLSFCVIGQPALVMLYYRAWAMNNKLFVTEAPTVVTTTV